MLYYFKKHPEDFVVEELLDFVPSGSGDALYVFFEKRDANTMDVINGLMKKLWLPRSAFGIAGLKDKQAITRQRITMYKGHIDKIGGEQIFLDALSHYGTILEKTYHPTPLQVGQNGWNRFVIYLRAVKKIDETIKGQIAKYLEPIQQHGFPNCFGTQRFGKGMRNFHRAKEIIEWTSEISGEFELKFKLQAYGSGWFNTYTLDRYRKNKRILDGDIVINKHNAFGIQTGVVEGKTIKLFDYKKCKEHYAEKSYMYPDFFTETIDLDTSIWKPTGPILGNNIIIPPQGSPAWNKERELYKKINFFLWPAIDVCTIYKIFWLRRALRVVPENLEYNFANNGDMTISFALPTGAYATTLLGTLFEHIDKQTVIQNKWNFPEAE
jgi:tRNA pseudouridine13 synthase